MAFTILSDLPRYPLGGRFVKEVRFDANGDTSGTVDLDGVGATEVNLVEVTPEPSSAAYVVSTIDSNGVALSGLSATGRYNVKVRGL